MVISFIIIAYIIIYHLNAHCSCIVDNDSLIWMPMLLLDLRSYRGSLLCITESISLKKKKFFVVTKTS